MSTTLADHDARERFEREIDANFCVSAGAGVGKTTAIVRRVVEIALREPDWLPRLVVVTYTKAAAEELRVRARNEILDQLERAGERRHALLSGFRRAFFGTIHSFCLRLVQEHGRTLALPQNCELLAPGDEDDFWRRFCESQEIERVTGTGLPVAEILRFITFEDVLESAHKLSAAAAEEICKRYVHAVVPPMDFRDALAERNPRARALPEQQQRLREWLEEFRSGAEFVGLPKCEKGGAAFLAKFRRELHPLAAWVNRAGARIAAEIALAFRDFRVSEGRMSYDDQIAWCRRLLDDASILRRLRAREHIVILDEAQDTDAAMFAILTELTRPADAPVGAWPRDPDAPGPLPGRFCFVGDEQQAIYGRADLATYRTYLDAFSAGRGGERIEFSVTMRCPQRVVRAVNAMFSNGSRIAQRHLAFRELRAKPEAEEGATWMLKLEPPPEHLAVADAFRLECEQAAAFVRERGLAGLGLSHWGGLAVLCPQHSWLEIAAGAFRRAELPARLAAQRKLALEMPHRSWPAALLYVLTHPWNRFELLGVLREIFCVSDRELANAHLRNRRLHFYSRDNLSPRLAAALDLLRALRDELPPLGGKTLSRFVDGILRETSLAGRLELIGEPADALEEFRREAAQAECDGLTIDDWAKQLYAGLRQAAAGRAESPDEIQLCTCMSAKGLEWDAVLPLGLTRNIIEKAEEFPRLRSGADGAEVHFSGETLDENIEEQLKTARLEEFQRVFYVTVTRPRRLLIFPDSSGFYKDGASNFLKLLRWSELELTAAFGPPATLAPRAGREMVRELSPTPALDPRVVAAAAASSRAIPRRVLPHELGHVTIETPEREPATEIGGIEYGTWWHRTMQYFPWTAGDAQRREYLESARARALAIPTLGARAAGELSAWPASKFCGELLAAGQHFLAEVPFSHPRSAGEWIKGVIDLVVITSAGELWIVDWKTDRRRVDESEPSFSNRLATLYLPQLQAYAEVLRAGMNRQPKRLALYSTELACAIE
jgi:ATP-dependent exoDNAse (exonuclease V) beta subunit